MPQKEKRPNTILGSLRNWRKVQSGTKLQFAPRPGTVTSIMMDGWRMAGFLQGNESLHAGWTHPSMPTIASDDTKKRKLRKRPLTILGSDSLFMNMHGLSPNKYIMYSTSFIEWRSKVCQTCYSLAAYDKLVLAIYLQLYAWLPP